MQLRNSETDHNLEDVEFNEEFNEAYNYIAFVDLVDWSGSDALTQQVL